MDDGQDLGHRPRAAEQAPEIQGAGAANPTLLPRTMASARAPTVTPSEEGPEDRADDGGLTGPGRQARPPEGPAYAPPGFAEVEIEVRV